MLFWTPFLITRSTIVKIKVLDFSSDEPNKTTLLCLEMLYFYVLKKFTANNKKRSTSCKHILFFHKHCNFLQDYSCMAVSNDRTEEVHVYFVFSYFFHKLTDFQQTLFVDFRVLAILPQLGTLYSMYYETVFFSVWRRVLFFLRRVFIIKWKKVTTYLWCMTLQVILSTRIIILKRCKAEISISQ